MRRCLTLSMLAGVLVFTAGQAHAHSKPKTMVPDANATVSAPNEVSVIFTEGLEPKFSSLEVTDERAKVVSKAVSRVDPADSKHMTLALPKLGPGVYHVRWVTAATDGHRANGEYSFTVK